MFTILFNRLSLRAALIINVIVPLIFVMGLASFGGFRILEHVVEKRMQEDVKLVARALRLPLSYSLEKERFGTISKTLEFVFHIGRVYGAYVYNEQGERIAEAGAVEPRKQDNKLLDVMEGGERTGKYEKIKGRQVYSYFVPLLSESGQSRGLLQITRKKSDFEDYISQLRARTFFLLSGFVVFIAGFVLFGFHRTAGRHFAALTESMVRIQEGERSHRASLTGPKEIVSLASSLNNMLDSVDRSEKENTVRREAQRELENKLRQSEKMAAIGQLAGGLAHELGAPISLIDGKAQRCLRDSNLSQRHKQNLLDIRDQVQRMNNIVRQLLDFGKGTMREKRWCRIDDLVRSAVSTVQQESSNNAPIEIAGPEGGTYIYIDPLRFEQVLVNLLRNAIQAGEGCRVRLSWGTTEENGIEFRVEDEGPGIADEIKPRIFEPFFSTHKTSYNTGLGLSVVHGIVREHDGVIDVYDTSNGGAGFRIVLPKNASAKQEEKNK